MLVPSLHYFKLLIQEIKLLCTLKINFYSEGNSYWVQIQFLKFYYMESVNIAIIIFQWDMMHLVFAVDRILSLTNNHPYPFTNSLLGEGDGISLLPLCYTVVITVTNSWPWVNQKRDYGVCLGLYITTWVFQKQIFFLAGDKKGRQRDLKQAKNVTHHCWHEDIGSMRPLGL